MNYKYDPKTDILIIKLGEGRPEFAEQKDNIITHFNNKEKPVELEILDASKTAVEMLNLIVSQKKIPVIKKKLKATA